MKKVIIDTNFLLIPGQFRIDIFSEIRRVCSFAYSVCVVDRTVDELEKIAGSGNGKDSSAAKLGEELLKKSGAEIIRSRSGINADDAIVEEASKDPLNTIVATQDLGLRKRLKSAGAGVIVMSGKTHLILL